jgi:pyrroloquinoline-quinone synthase
MHINDFWNLLEQRIAKYDLLCHPFYEAWSAGELTQKDLRDYAADYWHHVAAFPTYLSALHSRLEDGELRRTVLQNLADEEGLESPDRKPHAELWMDFARGMGANAMEVRTSEPIDSVGRLIQHFRRLMTEAPALALAALYAYESQVPRIAAEKAKGLRELYGANAGTCRYFTLHQTADVHHAAVWKREIESLIQSDPIIAERTLDAAETTAQKLWEALDGIEQRRKTAMLQ